MANESLCVVTETYILMVRKYPTATGAHDKYGSHQREVQDLLEDLIVHISTRRSDTKKLVTDILFVQLLTVCNLLHV